MTTNPIFQEINELGEKPWEVHIASSAMELIHNEGAQAFPDECCGFLYGEGGDTRQITLAVAVKNSQEGDQRRRFQIDPLDYMRAEQFAFDEGLELLGIYHTHPNHPAKPSIHDLNQAMPEFSYLILSVQEGTPDHARSWRLGEAGFFQEENLTIS